MSDTPHLDLDVLEGENPEEPACTFTLGGRTWSCRHSDDVPFDVIAQLFGSVDDERKSLVAIEPFFRGVLYPDDVEDFSVLLHEQDSPLTLRTLRPLIEHVASSVLGRPTGRPGRSAPGSLPKPRTSTAV